MPHYTSSSWADERNGTGLFINCVAASGVNIARAATNGAVPFTDAEVIALRKATGDVTGGQTLGQLEVGMERRYGFGGDRTHSWIQISDGLLKHGTWFAVVGWYRNLPSRLQNPGQADVFHCVAIGPTSAGACLVDPLQRGTVEARPITMLELQKFTASGGHDALGIEEFSQVPHVVVYCKTKLSSTFFYTRSGTVWKRRRVLGVQFSARCTPVVWETVLGKRRQMTRITTGAHEGTWLNIAAAHITYRGGDEE